MGNGVDGGSREADLGEEVGGGAMEAGLGEEYGDVGGDGKRDGRLGRLRRLGANNARRAGGGGSRAGFGSGPSWVGLGHGLDVESLLRTGRPPLLRANGLGRTVSDGSALVGGGGDGEGEGRCLFQPSEIVGMGRKALDSGVSPGEVRRLVRGLCDSGLSGPVASRVVAQVEAHIRGRVRKAGS